MEGKSNNYGNLTLSGPAIKKSKSRVKVFTYVCTRVCVYVCTSLMSSQYLVKQKSAKFLHNV